MTTHSKFHPLGSASLELDQNAAIISYEEYHPFGTTSYRSGRTETEVSLKRYKYVGKERDEETGLYYYGARYYASWIARFVSVDPMKAERTWLTPYNYVQNNPINRIDPTGAFDDDYLIRDNGEILIKKTDDKFDRFFVETSIKREGNVSNRIYRFVGQLDKNENNLIALPKTFNSEGITFAYHGSNDENFISGKAFAGLLGAINEVGYKDLSFGHWSNSEGNSPNPSRSHKYGEVGDFRPLRLDKTGIPVLTTDNQFDNERNASFISALKKFAWTSILSEKNPTTGYITPGTTHYSGYTDKKTGEWKDVRHNNHFHIQKFKPNLIHLLPNK